MARGGTLRCLWAAALAVAAMAPEAASAAGTPAGTVIENVAEVSFSIGGERGRLASPPAVFRVAELVEAAAVAVAPLASAAPAEEALVVAFRLVNLGNGPEAFDLELEPAAPGAAFAVLPRQPALYIDDGSGVLDAGDVAFTGGGTEPLLAADASLLVFAVVDVPADAVDGARGRLALTARALTGTGSPGTGFAGAGTDGVDVVIGASGGAPVAAAELVIGAADVALAKNAIVLDAAGGARPEPGARITYALDVTVSGSGEARGIVVTDPVPPATRFVPGSLELDGTALTDAADGDAGRFLVDAGQIEVVLGDLPAGATRRVRFAVEIE